MAERQKTLKTSITISGKGLHTGEFVNLSILPAAENFGYQFKRIDLEHQPLVKADVDYVVSTERGTTLEHKGARISTTEHVLAALYGLEVDNALIELDGSEIPILDGSAKPFVDAILKAGIQEQNAEREYYELKTNLAFEDAEKQIEMLAVPSEDFRVTVMVDYHSPMLGTQHAMLHHLNEFKEDFASCRTFVFLREIEPLYKLGLIKGGDIDNAIVMVDKEVSKAELKHLAELFNHPELDVNIEGIGILNNVKLKYENEPARHKLLDIIGDLALVGVPIKGHILAARPGHSTNIAFAKQIKELIKKDKKSVPQFNLNVEPLYDVNSISKILPHRYPFLLVDRILELKDDYIVGIKNVTINEDFFTGHFPGNPVMPGVLIVEAMAQTGGILVLSTVPDPENYQTYFMKIDGVKFKQKVIPGDTLIFKCDLLAPIRRGICYMKAVAYVRDKVVAEGELMAQIIKEIKDEPSLSIHTS